MIFLNSKTTNIRDFVGFNAKYSLGRASFTCVCNKGYRKVGSQCEAIKTCEENPGICGRNAICVDLNPFYKCVCDSDTIDKSKS